MSSSEGSNPELNIEECKFQTSHHLCESRIPGIGGEEGGRSASLRMDGAGWNA